MKISVSPKHVLVVDAETVAAGFADPEWVPNRVTAIAWSWVGEDKVVSRCILDYAKTLNKFLESFFLGCRPMLEEFVSIYSQADVIAGHNIARFDIGVFNAELMRLRMPVLKPKSQIDTMKLKPSKGFKKGLDVIGEVLGVPVEKKPMNWGQWQKAYATAGWQEVKDRCAGDVVLSKHVLAELQELEYLR